MTCRVATEAVVGPRGRPWWAAPDLRPGLSIVLVLVLVAVAVVSFLLGALTMRLAINRQAER